MSALRIVVVGPGVTARPPRLAIALGLLGAIVTLFGAMMGLCWLIMSLK